MRIGDEAGAQLCEEDHPDSLHYDDLSKVEDLQQFFAAGAAAEEIVFGTYRPHGTRKDGPVVNAMEELKVQAETGTAPENVDVFDEYVQRVRQWLPKDKVRAVKDALLEKGFLDREALQSVFNGAE